jgi:hypothetical protein
VKRHIASKFFPNLKRFQLILPTDSFDDVQRTSTSVLRTFKNVQVKGNTPIFPISLNNLTPAKQSNQEAKLLLQNPVIDLILRSNSLLWSLTSPSLCFRPALFLCSHTFQSFLWFISCWSTSRPYHSPFNILMVWSHIPCRSPKRSNPFWIPWRIFPFSFLERSWNSWFC